MSFVLAYAQSSDSSDTNLALIVYWLGIIATVAVLAGGPALAAKRRGHRQTNAIGILMLLWAITMGASVIWAITVQLTWSAEHTRQIMTGYLDPSDNAGHPGNPWLLWIIATAGYVLVIVWIFASEKSSPSVQEPEA